MTNYHLPTSSLPSQLAQQAKHERKHLLDAVRKRRYQQEQGRWKKQRQAYQTNEEYREYQDMLQEEATL